MKGNPQTAVYLICPKNKSLQRKHVEVCRRCKSNSRCKPYIEYSQNTATENLAETPTDIDRSHVLRHIIQELHEIRKMTHSNTMNPSAPRPKRRKRRRQRKLVIRDIQKALKDIQSLCRQADRI
jgi:hypothetical protein